jgi:alkylated DNA repair dioxygenase AlkB
MKLDIVYKKEFLDNDEGYHLFNEIKSKSFEKKEFLDNNNNKMPRLIKWYGDFSYSYANIWHNSEKIPEIIEKLMNKVNNFLLEEKINSKMNSVLINYYRDGKDKINYHSDDLSQIGYNPVICSISLGETRVFSFKNKETKEKTNIELGHGDLCIMKGDTQEKWLHGILPETNKQERINLTFRNTLNNPIIKN